MMTIRVTESQAELNFSLVANEAGLPRSRFDQERAEEFDGEQVYGFRIRDRVTGYVIEVRAPAGHPEQLRHASDFAWFQIGDMRCSWVGAVGMLRAWAWNG